MLAYAPTHRQSVLFLSSSINTSIVNADVTTCFTIPSHFQMAAIPPTLLTGSIVTTSSKFILFFTLFRNSFVFLFPAALLIPWSGAIFARSVGELSRSNPLHGRQLENCQEATHSMPVPYHLHWELGGFLG